MNFGEDSRYPRIEAVDRYVRIRSCPFASRGFSRSRRKDVDCGRHHMHEDHRIVRKGFLHVSLQAFGAKTLKFTYCVVNPVLVFEKFIHSIECVYICKSKTLNCILGPAPKKVQDQIHEPLTPLIFPSSSAELDCPMIRLSNPPQRQPCPKTPPISSLLVIPKTKPVPS